MTLSKIVLKDYDMVLALTQNAINQALAELLQHLNKSVALYYDTNKEGQYVPVRNKSEAKFIFTGNLGIQKNKKGNYITPVTLYTDKGNQTVQYSVTFTEATFQAKPINLDIKQTPGKPWVMNFFTNLAKASISSDLLPTQVAESVKQATQGIPPDAFSIQQLYLDLNTATFDSFENITGLTALAGDILASLIQDYLKELQKQGGTIFGYSVQLEKTVTGVTKLVPTYIDIAVTPYVGANGEKNPGLDTLDYLIMLDHHKPPAYPPKSFPFNWVSDENIQGSVGIKFDLIQSLFTDSLNPILKTVCPKLKVKASVKKNIYDQEIKLEDGDNHTFTPKSTPSDGKVAYLSYDDSKHDSDRGWLGGTIDDSAKYSSGTDLYFSGNFVELTGLLSMRVSIDTGGTGGNADFEMPKTTFDWSAKYELQVNPAVNGELLLKYFSSDFNSKPHVAHKHESWWDKFLNSLSGQIKITINDLKKLRTELADNIKQQIEDDVKSKIKLANQFVFPGAQIFAFKNPQFSDALDLVGNVTYYTPS